MSNYIDIGSVFQYKKTKQKIIIKDIELDLLTRVIIQYYCFNSNKVRHLVYTVPNDTKNISKEELVKLFNTFHKINFFTIFEVIS